MPILPLKAIHDFTRSSYVFVTDFPPNCSQSVPSLQSSLLPCPFRELFEISNTLRMRQWKRSVTFQVGSNLDSHGGMMVLPVFYVYFLATLNISLHFGLLSSCTLWADDLKVPPALTSRLPESSSSFGVYLVRAVPSPGGPFVHYCEFLCAHS